MKHYSRRVGLPSNSQTFFWLYSFFMFKSCSFTTEYYLKRSDTQVRTLQKPVIKQNQTRVIL